MIFKSVVSTAIRYVFLFHVGLTIRLTKDIAVLPIESLICTTLDFSIRICERIVGIYEFLIRLLLISTFIVIFVRKVCIPF